jgi:hypothetical protein
MLEGKELEGKIGDVGSYSLDVDMTGNVTVAVSVAKDFGGAKVSSTNGVEVHIFTLLEKLAAKTAATWDDAAIAKIKALLNLVG